MPSPPLRVTPGVPKGASRLRWNMSLNVGLDLEDILGLSSSLTNIAAALIPNQLVASQMKPFAGVESFDFGQARQIYERFALGPNSFQAFQNIPMGVTTTIKMGKIVFKNLQDAETVFNFFPNNLLFQQLPFIIQLVDNGDGSNPKTQIVHYFFGCWFVDTAVRYDVVSHDDQRLIQSATVRASRVLTLDASVGGSPVVQAAQNAIGGILSTPSAQNLVSGLPLF